MGNEFGKRKSSLTKHVWRTGVMTALAVIIYYLPSVFVKAGWVPADSLLYSLHGYFEIDVYAIVFFAPVAYAAYTVGMKWALATALLSMLLLFPYAIDRGQWVAMLQPTAFAIILAAVGAAVSMLQRSDEQQRHRISELVCLDNVGTAAKESQSVDSFLSAVLETVGEAIPEIAGVRISCRVCKLESRVFERSDFAITADLAVGEEKVGYLEVFLTAGLKSNRAFVIALAGRISGAVHEIELQQSLNRYYVDLEDMVEKRSKELEQVQEKLVRSERLAAVGELASAVSHELRNPLNVIKNCVYLLNMSLEDKDATNEEETKDTLKMINQQVNISNRIVTDLLDFTRSKSPSSAPTELTGLIEQSLSWIIVPPGITVSKSLSTNGSRVLIDSDQVGRALANVLTNAIQAIVGAGRVHICSAIEGDFACIDIEDTGCGIPAENVDKIFEPLFTTKPNGTGLGLAITKKLMEQNGGTIEVESELDKGTTFCIKLPLERKEIISYEESADRARG
ncbi:MAG: hypothetical protein HY662_03050 [Chloroflexi bacterium]|nr:hypothetical protein [Chloroflexota bacterium]